MSSGRSQERSGLVLIACTLIAIAVTSGLVLKTQRDERRERNRAQGAALARLLSSLPYEQLVPSDSAGGTLRVVRTSQTNPDFAYAVVVGLHGEPLMREVAPGVVVPPAPLPAEPSAWVGEREIGADGRPLREFFAPVLQGGERVAHLRVGFLEPGLLPPAANASLLGALALPIFLLVPVAYGMLRREVRPVAAAVRQLDSLLAGGSLQPVQVAAQGELGDFVRSFNRFVELVEHRMQEAEGEASGVRASVQVLSYQKSRIESVIETLPDATLVLDETGTVTYANSRLDALLGVDPAEVVGRKPAEWCPVPELVSLLANYEGPSPRLRRSDVVEFSLGADGGRRLAATAYPLTAQAGPAAAAGTVVLLRDVTATNLARQAQGDFVSHVAHELKGPLHVIGMYSEALTGREGDSEQFRIEACNALRDEVERVSGLIGTLLTIAKIESGSVVVGRQRVRLHDFLSDVLETGARGSGPRDLRLRLEAPQGTTVQIDKELMRVALNNLIRNAIKYNRDGGEVVLFAEETPEQLVIGVRDTGLGIGEKDRERVFEKFYRSEDPEIQRRGGHGLGLALVREIAALHGAEVELASAPGEGSVFSIRLPRSEAGTLEGGEQ